MRSYFVYILTNKTKTVLYTGVTNDLSRRIDEHMQDALGNKQSFSGKYNCIHLLYYEEYRDIREAISREKEIKGWTRAKKVTLIKLANPEMQFLNIG
ncbi:GIY-YIG nuclease family protein [Taibaiella koreensis]|uniref:GIY-YIG nuclease family protein n=1 Tax=Taibaiella koreensis TaxID=1268548 RepID=UPI000E59F790|nr:GIY-YIG nuclease family protein [Taibaiella koreensis]